MKTEIEELISGCGIKRPAEVMVKAAKPVEDAPATEVIQVRGWRQKPYREHQITAIKRAGEHFLTHDRGQLIIPCGGGKTAIAQGIREELGAGLTLVLVPSLMLIKQFMEELARWASIFYQAMCVCSDNDILGEIDAVSIGCSEMGGAVSTDPAIIAKFLRRRGPKVVFSTYQSLAAVCEAANKAEVTFDLAVCDEAHRTAGNDLGIFGQIHDESHVKIRKRLYMTATPRVTGSPRNGYDRVYDMDNPDVFGTPFFQMTFKEAIDRGLLVDYRIVAIGISSGQVTEWMRKHDRPGKDAPVRDLAMNYALNLAMRKYGARHAVTYHSLVNAAAKFAERHRRLFADTHTTHVNGAQSMDERRGHLDAFRRAPQSVVTNARCLVEGVDVPAIDLVMFCDPKQSTIDVVQAAGRALRTDKARENKRGIILLPILHSREEALESGVSRGPFELVAKVVRALSDEDEVLKGAITGAVAGLSYSNKQIDSEVAGRCKLELLGFEQQIENQLFSQVVSKAAIGWDVQFEHLLEFRRRYPDSWPMAKALFPGSNRLGGWCRHQRKVHMQKRLPDDRVQRLSQIGFPIDPTDSWVAQYHHLLEFRKTHPDRWPTARTLFPGRNRLGWWCHHQRTLHRQKRLLADWVQRLAQIGFPFNRTDTWMAQYHQLLEFRKSHPDQWPTWQVEFPVGNRLGFWCVTQRATHKMKRLPKDRFQGLSRIGFPFELTDTWMAQYRQLLEFRKAHPHRWPARQTESPNENALATWLQTQLRRRGQGVLTEDRIRLLDGIGFQWKGAKSRAWMVQYGHLLEFRKAFPGKWPSALAEFPRGNKLGAWCYQQRNRYKRHKLAKSRIELLARIEFCFNLPDVWPARYQQLVQYRMANPFNWPKYQTQFPPGNKLGHWCNTQRQERLKHKMSKDRIALLDQIGFLWTPGSRPQPHSSAASKKQMRGHIKRM